MFPLVGSMLGGTQIIISGPCFSDTDNIVCDFDGIQVTGQMISGFTALCVSPTFFGVGRIPLSVSLDGGNNFDFEGKFTLRKSVSFDRYYLACTLFNSLVGNSLEVCTK